MSAPYLYDLDVTLELASTDEDGIETWEASILRNGPSLHVKATMTPDEIAGASWEVTLALGEGDDAVSARQVAAVVCPTLTEAYEATRDLTHQMSRVTWGDVGALYRAVREREHDLTMRRARDRANHARDEEAMPL